MPLSFPVETPRDQHGRLKNEMADRVVDKITKYAPNFKDIQIRHITFAPYHMNTMSAPTPATSATGSCTRT